MFRSSKLAWLHQVVDRSFAMSRKEGRAASSRTSDHALKLTDDEAHQLREEIDDLVDSWADRTRGRDPERRTYLLVQMVQPYPDEPTDPTEPAG